MNKIKLVSQLFLELEFQWICRNRQRETSVAMNNPISTNTELEKKNTLDTNIVCMFTKVTFSFLKKYLLKDNFPAKIKIAVICLVYGPNKIPTPEFDTGY